MAVVTLKSTQITNRDATPKVLSNGRVNGAPVRHARGALAGGVADSIASKYIMCSVPSNAMPSSVRINTTGTGTVGATDIGLYRNTQDGGAVVDADFFASALLLTTALTKSDQTYESGVITKLNGEKAIWELLGLASDPSVVYDVVATLTATVDAAHDVLIEIDYTQ